MRIGQFIKEARKQRKLTQKDLSEGLALLGIDYAVSTIGWWETGRTIPPVRDPEFVNALAEVLKVQPAEIFLAAGYDVAVDGPQNERESRLLAAFRRGDIKELLRVAIEE